MPDNVIDGATAALYQAAIDAYERTERPLGLGGFRAELDWILGTTGYAYSVRTWDETMQALEAGRQEERRMREALRKIAEGDLPPTMDAAEYALRMLRPSLTGKERAT